MQVVKVKVKYPKEKQPVDRGAILTLGEVEAFLDIWGKKTHQCPTNILNQ